MSFNNLIKQYGKIHKLGKQIIKHKKYVNNVPKNKIQLEFHKQEIRIQQFVDLINKANQEWKNNPNTIDKYWTGY